MKMRKEESTVGLSYIGRPSVNSQYNNGILKATNIPLTGDQ